MRRTASLSSTAGSRETLSLADVRIGCCWPASGWRPIATPGSRANRAYEEYRETGRDTHGRRLGRRPEPWVAPALPDGVVSVSDPDTQRIKASRGYVQGDNPQAVVDEGQIVVAADITNTPGDFSNLDPMICAALSELDRAGIVERPQVALADAGYCNEQHLDEVIANKHIQVLIPPERGGGVSPGPGGQAGATHGCEPCWPQSPARVCTASE